MATPPVPPPSGPPAGPVPAADRHGHGHENLRGILWILFSVVMASAMSLSVRALAGEMDSRMIVLFRAAVLAVLVGMPLIPNTPLRRQMGLSRPWLHLIRGAMIGFATHFGFYTLASIPIATASVLFFTAPIFATILAGIFQGERVGPRRVAAVAAGFLGAVIILRPGFGVFHPAMLAGLASSACFAVALTMSRGLVKADGWLAAYFSSVVVTVIVSLPLAWPVLGLPTSGFGWAVAAVLVVTAFGRGVADLLAYRYAEAAVLAPITYLRLVLLGVAGYVFWGEVPDGPTLAGAAVIVAATLYIARREAQLARAAKT